MNEKYIIFSDKLNSLLKSNLINDNNKNEKEIITSPSKLELKLSNNKKYLQKNKSNFENQFTIIEDSLEKLIDLINEYIKNDNENIKNIIQNINEIKNKYDIKIKNDSNDFEQKLKAIKLGYNKIINIKDENEFKEEKKINDELIKLSQDTQTDFSLIISKYLQYKKNHNNSFDDINFSFKDELTKIKNIIGEENILISNNYKKYKKELLSIKFKIKPFQREEINKINNFKDNINQLINETIMKIK